jgi:hypothetical protein
VDQEGVIVGVAKTISPEELRETVGSSASMITAKPRGSTGLSYASSFSLPSIRSLVPCIELSLKLIHILQIQG